MSRLFDALQSARPDITERFDTSGGRDTRSDAAPRPLVQGRFEEQFSALLERLDEKPDGHGARTIGFAGLRGGEGATTVAHEFAGFIATHLQAPTLVLDVEPNHAADVEPGIDGPADSNEPSQGLYARATLVLSDRAPPTAERIGAVLAPLSSRFGWILVDGPPLLGAGGSAPALAALDHVIVVAEAERTHARDVQRAAQNARAAGANVAGMILNKRPNRIPRPIRTLLRRLHLA